VVALDDTLVPFLAAFATFLETFADFFAVLLATRLDAFAMVISPSCRLPEPQ
jgi:hypothetical protein